MKPRRPAGAKPAATDDAVRPAAGHRFGPDLFCHDCGVYHGEHRRSPRPCPGPKVSPRPARGETPPHTPPNEG